MNNKKQFATYLYSSVGAAVMVVIVIALNVIVRPVIKRLDLTKDKLYTLSEGTRRILGRIDTPVQIRFYFSQSDPATPVEFKTYATRVEDLLNEYKLHAKGNLEVKKLDPQPDSDAEDSASVDGVEGQPLSPLGGDKIYFGLAISCLDARAAIPYLNPARERLLEYDLTRAIAQVIKPTKPIVGVMSGLPVFGEFNPMMMRMGGGRQEPWLFVNELKADFNVKEIQLGADKIDDDVQVLLVIYPKGISEVTQYAIDQFVLRGGKLVAFLDPLSIMDTRSMNPQNPLQGAANSGASLDLLLKAWGLSFDISKVVADKEYFTEMGGEGGRPQVNPSVLQLPAKAVDTNDVVTSQISRLFLPFTGAFSGSPVEGLKQTVLLRSSANSDLTEKMLAQFGGAGQDFKASGKEYPLAVRLTGKFKTAFPDGKPGEKADNKGEKKEGEEKKTEAKTSDSLKESKEDGVVVLVGDADMLHEQFYVRVMNLGGMRVMDRPFSQNLPFLQNLVELLSGDKDLISMRSRATMSRPFTKVRELQAKAEERFANKIKELEKGESDLNQKINELVRGKQPGQHVILSEEAKKEWNDVQKKRAEVRGTLKQERKNLRKDIDSLQTRLQWTNILVMPLAVAAAGVALALVKRKKTAAR
jgi:ABC-type uncharacterized transport system involved in gliding motility auxiliary subunit